MASYIFQGFASIAFGPLFGLASIFAGPEPTSNVALPERGLCITTYFLPMATTMHQSNLIVAISVLASPVKRLQTTTPLAERAFINGLAGYQMLAAFIGTASYAVTHEVTARRAWLVSIHMFAVGVISTYTSRPPSMNTRFNGVALCGVSPPSATPNMDGP